MWLDGILFDAVRPYFVWRNLAWKYSGPATFVWENLVEGTWFDKIIFDEILVQSFGQGNLEQMLFGKLVAADQSSEHWS